MRSGIVFILTDGTALYIEAGEFEHLLLKNTAVLARQLGQEHLIGIRRISRIKSAVLQIRKTFPHKLRRYFQRVT